MSNTSALRRRLLLGFALVLILAGAVSFVSFVSLRSVINSKDDVIQDYAQDDVQMRDLQVAAERIEASSRAFLLTGDEAYLRQGERARGLYHLRIDELRATADFPGELKLLDGALAAEIAHEKALDDAVSAQRRAVGPKEIVDLFEEGILPRSRDLREALQHLVTEKDKLAARALEHSRRKAARATVLVATLGGSAAALCAGLFLLSIRNLRRLESAEGEIRTLNESLEARVAARTREIEGFAYSIAHDLRAPLRTMAGVGDILLEDYGARLDDTGREHLGRIRNAAIRMDALINGLLGLARFSYQPFELDSVDLQDAVRTTLAADDPEIRASGAEVRVEVPAARVQAHPLLLSIALSQLVSNALKFVAPGVVPKIRVWAEHRGNRMRVAVTDNGIGIDPRYHQRIFGMFHRLHPGDVYSGIGVGLTLAQRAVERMGGTIGLDSLPGCGSTFWIELEADQPARADAKTPGKPIPASR